MFRQLQRLFFFVLALGYCQSAYAEERASIEIFDSEGRTQSLVETSEGSRGTVRVLVQDNTGMPLEGVEISLVNSADSKQLRTAVSKAKGVASFFDVPSGSYQIQFGCGAFKISDVVISSSKPSSEEEGESDSLQVVDQSGAAIAFSEIPLGSRAQVRAKVVKNSGDLAEDVQLRIIEVAEGQQLETIGESSSSKKGLVEFSEVPAGEYNISVADCSKQYALGGVGIFDLPILALACPPGAALTSAARALEESGSSGAETVRILDRSGETQSLVQAEQGSRGTVKVFVRDAAGEPLVGVPVALRLAGSSRVFSTAVSQARGVASFFEVPTGTYQVDFQCGDYQFEQLKVDSPQKLTQEGGESDAVNIVDIFGATQSFGEVPIGGRSTLQVRVSSQSGASTENLKLRLTEVKNGKELEVLSEREVDSEGNVLFSDLPGGEYQLSVSSCKEQFQLGGVGLDDYAVSSLVCAPLAVSALTAGGGAGAGASAGAALGSALGIAPATVASTTAITATSVAAGVAAGGAAIGAGVAIDDSQDSSPVDPPATADPLDPPAVDPDPVPDTPTTTPETPSPAPSPTPIPDPPTPPPPDPPQPVSP